MPSAAPATEYTTSAIKERVTAFAARLSTQKNRHIEDLTPVYCHLRLAMRKLIFVGAIFLLSLSSNAIGQKGSNPFSSPFSSIYTSQNSKYLFVHRSTESLREYVSEARRAWTGAGMSSEEVSRRTGELQKEVNDEEQLRSRFPVTGLYVKNRSGTNLVEMLEPLEVFDDFLVSDSGDLVVGINRHVRRDIRHDTPYQELLQTDQALIGVLRIKKGLSCFKRVNEVVFSGAEISRGVHGFEWLEPNSVRIEEPGSLILTKLNGAQIRLKLQTCESSNSASK